MTQARKQSDDGNDLFSVQAGHDSEIAQKVELVTYYLPGSGKSCLLGSWSLHHQEEFPNDAVVYHFVGSSSDSTGKQYSTFCRH